MQMSPYIMEELGRSRIRELDAEAKRLFPFRKTDFRQSFSIQPALNSLYGFMATAVKTAKYTYTIWICKNLPACMGRRV